MLKYALLMVPLVLAAGGPHLALMVDDKLGVTTALASVPRTAKAFHAMTLTIIGLASGLSLGYLLGTY